MNKTISVNIDGKQIKAKSEDYILRVAIDNGIEIPSLCYHKKLSPTGACRVCIVKIKGVKGYVTSCSTKVTDGMEVIAFDEEIENERKHILRYLLSEHNVHNDNTYYDSFLDLIDKYDLSKNLNKKYKPINISQKDNSDNSSPILSYDASKCIKCFRCIKACSEIQQKDVLSMNERGVHSYVVAGIKDWKNSECDGCGECIQLCPTGALIEKPHRNEINLNKIDKIVKTTCPYCGVGCQLNMYVQDGKIVRSDGVEDILPNDGRLCVKGRFGYDFVHHKERLTKPLLKKNGNFVEISWDEAIKTIAEKLKEIKLKYGADSIAGYASAKCTNEDNYIFQKFFRKVIGTNNIDNCARLCHSSTVAALMRTLGDGAGTNSIEDYASTDCIYVTGNNIIETHPVTATYVKQGKANGAKIIVVDPKWTPLVKYADIWLQPKIGTDVALLNGLINIIIKNEWIDREFIENRIEGGWESFDKLKNLVKTYTPDRVEKITNVPKEKLEIVASLYANAKKPLIATGMGMSQEVTGTHNVFSLLNMCLITGHIGKENAGINPPRGQNNVQGVSDVGCMPMIYPGYIPVEDDENRKKVAKIWKTDHNSLPAKKGLTSIEIIKAASEEKLKALFIMGENTMMTDPNLNHTEEALKKLQFIVVQDIFMTETAKFADIILPAATFAEKDGTFVNSDRRVQRVRKAVESPGEAKEDWKIIIDIAKCMNEDIGDFNNASEIFDELTKSAPIISGISYKRIENEGIQWPCPDKNHKGTKTLFTDKFNTESGKAILNPVEYIEQNEQANDKFPFILNTGRILYHYHSATMSRRNKALTDFANQAYVLINKFDASQYNLQNNDIVRISNKRGEITTNVKVSEEVSIGEIFMPWHYNEALVNKLTRDEMDPFSKIAPFKLTAVKIEKV